MSNELDRLFREKLTDHKVQPGEAAWANIEASLGKEKKGIIWFRAAAAIVLLGLLTTTILWVRSGEEAAIVIAHVDSVRTSAKPKIIPAPKKAKKTNELRLPVVKTQARKVKVYIAQEEPKEAPGQTELPQPIQQEQTVAVAENETQPVMREQPELNTIKKPITLTYTLAPIPSREAQSVAVEKKGFQKIMNAAKEVKHSDGALTELRIIKDDLFALNFKKK